MKTLKQIFSVISIAALVANPAIGYCETSAFAQNYLKSNSGKTQPAASDRWKTSVINPGTASSTSAAIKTMLLKTSAGTTPINVSTFTTKPPTQPIAATMPRITTTGTIKTPDIATTSWKLPTKEQAAEYFRIAGLTNCTSSSETFLNGSIHIFWTNEAPVPVEWLNAAAPGWQLHMVISADFDKNGTTETQDWLMHSSMISGMGRGVDLDMPAELNGQKVTASFYITDAKGNPLTTKTTEDNKIEWTIGSKANKDSAYIFGAPAKDSSGKNIAGTEISFTVNRDPAAGEQPPKVAGYTLNGGSLTVDFDAPLDSFSFPTAFIVVNGIYTQITDYKYMLSNGARTLTVDLKAFGIDIPTGAKVEFVAKEWAHGMTLKQTIIQGTTPIPTTTPVSVKVGDSVTLGTTAYTAKTAFTYTADGKVPANIQLTDAKGRLFTTTATGLDQNSFLVNDTIKILGVDYTVTKDFTFKADGKIPQGITFKDAANKIYVTDAAGALKLESSVIPVSVKVGDSVTLGTTAYTAKTAFTYTADGKVPANIQLTDAKGRLFTTTATGLDQNSFLVNDTIKILGVDYTVTKDFTFKADGKIPQGITFNDAANKIYVTDAAGALKLESSVIPVSVKVGDSVTLGTTAYTAKTAFTYTADGKVPANIQLTDAKGRLFTTTATGLDQNSFLSGDSIRISGVDYTVTKDFTFKADGKIPQGITFKDAANKIYVTDAAGALKLESSVIPVSVKVGDSVTLGTTAYTAKTAFTYTADGKVPANIQLTDAKGRLFTTTATGLDQNSFLVNDTIKISGVDYTVTKDFTFKADGKIPQGITFKDAANKIYVTDAAGALKLESSVIPVSVKVGDSVTLGTTAYTAKTAFTYTADGKVPANIQLTDAKGRLFTTTATGLDQNSFLVNDTIKILGVDYTVTKDFTFKADGKIPQGITFKDAANKIYVTDAAGTLKLQSTSTPQTITLSDKTVLTAKTSYTPTADGGVPAGVEFTAADGRTYASGADDKFEQIGFIKGEVITLSGNVKLTVQTPFCRDANGQYPANAVLLDKDNNKWTITADGSFRQTTTKTVTLSDKTVLTTTAEFSYTADGDVPAGIRFTSADGKTYLSAADGKFEQIGFIKGEVITLSGNVKLTVQTPFSADANGKYPSNVILVDSANNKWTITTDGSFRQTSSKTVTLSDKTILTTTTEFTFTDDGGVPAGIRFTSAVGKTYLSAADGKFEQIGFIKGEVITLSGNVKLTVQTPFSADANGKYPSNVILVDSANNKWTITADGSFRQTSSKTVTLSDKTVLTTTTEFFLTTDGNVPADIKFTSANGKTYISKADGTFEQI